MTKTKDSPYAWFICFIGSSLLFYDFMNMTLFSSLGGYFANKYTLDAAALGALSAMLFLGNVIMQIPGGYVSDRFSVKRVLQIASFIGALSVLGLTLTDTLWQVKLYRLIMGFVSGYGFVTAIRLTANWISPKHYGIAMGSMITFGTLGGIVSQAPTAYLYSLVGGRNTLLCLAALGLVIFILISCFVRDKPADHIEDKTTVRKKSYPILPGLIKLLAKRQNWYISIYIALLALTTMLFSVIWSSRYLQTVFKYNNITANFITSTIFIGTIIGNPLIGLISDKVKSRKKPMIICAILAAVDMLIIIYCPCLNIIALTLLYFALGVIIGSLCLGYPFLAESNDIKFTGLITAIASMFVIGIPAIFQPVYGWIVDIVSKMDGAPNGVYTPHAFRMATLILPIGFILAMIFICLTKDSLKKE